MKKLILLLIIICPIKVLALADNAKSSVLMDYNTGTILYENNSNERLPMASMTKMMSLLIIMEQIDNNKLSLNDEIYISENASKMGGSQVFLEANTKMLLSELLKAICIGSANDAVVAVAEHIAGTKEQFVEMMNEKVKTLNLTNTHFMNVHGLDEENHYSSSYDMAIIARELIKHNKILEYSSIYEDYIEHQNGHSTWIVNTNKLINYYEGLDGLKTGYTTKAGYCITATAKKGETRLISVVMNEPSNKERNQDTIELLNYGFKNFTTEKILDIKNNLGYVNVNLANKERIKLTIKDNIYNIVKNDTKNNYTYSIKIDDIKIPLTTNDVIGTLTVYCNNNILNTYNLYSNVGLNKGNFFIYLKRNIFKFISGN